MDKKRSRVLSRAVLVLPLSTLLLEAILLFAGCGFPEEEGLGASSGLVDPAEMDCALCHNYSMLDTNHVYHLMRQPGQGSVNRLMLCSDCHYESIHTLDLNDPEGIRRIIPDLGHFRNRSFFSNRQDSLYTLSDETEVETVRAFVFAMIMDSTLPPLKTTLDHNDGVLQVSYPPTVTFPSQSEPRTCSNFNCHKETDRDYQW